MLETKNPETRIRTASDGLISSHGMAKEGISEFKDKSTKTSKSKRCKRILMATLCCEKLKCILSDN